MSGDNGTAPEVDSLDAAPAAIPPLLVMRGESINLQIMGTPGTISPEVPVVLMIGNAIMLAQINLADDTINRLISELRKAKKARGNHDLALPTDPDFRGQI